VAPGFGHRLARAWRSGTLWLLLYLTLTAILLGYAMLDLGIDWVIGAFAAASAIAVAFVVVLLVAAIRAILRRPSRRQWVHAGLFACVLLALGGLGITQPPALHAAQARVLEHAGQWQGAIDEYTAAGRASAHDVARVYDEWGERLAAARHYDDAIAKFAVVVASYGTLAPEAPRAQVDMVNAYLVWASQEMAAGQYQQASALYDLIFALPYCDAACTGRVIPLAAETYLEIGQRALAAHDYAVAISTLLTGVARFPSAARSAGLHAALATALRGAGTMALAAHSCTQALSTYQTLAKSFADTSEGRQSARDLQAPVSVRGRFTTAIPPGGVAYLGMDLYGKLVSKGIYAAYFSLFTPGTPHTTVQSDGQFVFAGVSPGDYDLAWGYGQTFNGDPAKVIMPFSNNHAAYQAHAQPLCGFDFGAIDYLFAGYS
jgi:hypothetical protein